MKVGSLIERVKVSTGEPMPSEINRVIKAAGYRIPPIGEPCVVRGIINVGGEIGIYLEEYVNPKLLTFDGPFEYPFHIDLFRELQPPMDLSEIEEILKPQTVIITL